MHAHINHKYIKNVILVYLCTRVCANWELQTALGTFYMVIYK